MAQTQIAKDDRSLGDLFAELLRETSTLVRQEVALAQNELTEKAARIGRNVGFLAIGGAIAYAGLLAMVAGLIALLAAVIPVWLAALLVGAVIVAGSMVLIVSALNKLKRTDPLPRESIHSIKEDAQWLKKEIMQ